MSVIHVSSDPLHVAFVSPRNTVVVIQKVHVWRRACYSS